MAKLKKVRICVIGDIMIDRYIYGSVDRISPEAPVPVLEREREELFLGGAGLVATNLSGLGADVKLVSVAGDDEARGVLSRLLERERIDAKIADEAGRKTIEKVRYIATKPYFQMIVRVDSETLRGISKSVENEILASLRRCVKDSDLLIVSDYGKGLLTNSMIKRVVSYAKEERTPILVDAKHTLLEYSGADYVLPNSKEICLAFSHANSNDDDVVLPLAIRLEKEMGSTVIVKRAERGATLVKGGRVKSFPSRAKNIVNTSGAGDIFIAIVGLALASGSTVERAIMLANMGCAKAVAREHPSITLKDIM